jgi:hypothetical protein
MREVTSHRTAGLDELTDSLEIVSDDPDDKNGSGTHYYSVVQMLTGRQVAEVQFQHGPRNQEGSTPGLTAQALITVLIDHFESFQNGPFRCRENARIISYLEDAKNIMIQRVIDRKRRGVLGQTKV